jgi:hypothetical protein
LRFTVDLRIYQEWIRFCDGTVFGLLVSYVICVSSSMSRVSRSRIA